MPAALIAELVHKGPDFVCAAGIRVGYLRKSCDGDSGEAGLIQSPDVRQVGRQTREAQALDLLQPVDRPPARIAIVGIANPEFVDHRGADGEGFRKIEAFLLAKLVTNAKARQVAFPPSISKLVLDVAAVNVVAVTQALVEPGHCFVVGRERCPKGRAEILRSKYARVAEIGKRIKPVLDRL